MIRSSWLKWKLGRSGRLYSRLNLLPMFIMNMFNIDITLLKFERGSIVDWHVDNDYLFNDYEHHRLNIVLWGYAANSFTYAPTPPQYMDRFKFLWFNCVKFRPDIVPHKVNLIRKKRYVLSFGKIKKSKLVNSNHAGAMRLINLYSATPCLQVQSFLTLDRKIGESYIMYPRILHSQILDIQGKGSGSVKYKVSKVTNRNENILTVNPKD